MSEIDSGEAARPEICVILNGRSGKRDTSLANTIRAAFNDCGATAEIRILRKGSDIAAATRAALKDGFSTIVAAGGDGTISAVASVLCGTDAVMGIIPLGTFNYFARSLDIPVEIPQAVRLVSNGVRRNIRLATINDQVFVNNASLGAYPAILKTREDIYNRWGRSRAAAYWSVLVTLVTLRRPLHLKIDTGSEVIERRTPLVFAVNNAFQLEQLGLEGCDDIAEGRLVLFVAPDSTRWGMLRHAMSLALGRAEQNVNFDLIAADQILITTDRSERDVARDGERSRMRAPYRLQVVEDALSVLVPETRQEDTR